MSNKRKTGGAAEAPPPLEELQLERVIGLSPHTNSVAHHPSRQEVAYCAGSVVVLYDATSNTQRAFLRAASASKPFISVAYSADGAHVAAGESGSHPSVVVWDTETGACLVELKSHKHGIGSVAFSPSGKQVASCGTTYDGQVCLFAWQSKTLLGRERTQSELRSVAFSCDGGAVVSCGKNHLKIWSINQVGGRGSRGPAAKHQPSVTLSGRAPILGGYKSHTLVGVASSQAMPGHGPVYLYAATSQGVLLQMKSSSRSYDLSVDLKVREVFALAVSESAVAVACSDGIVRLFAARTLSFKANLPRPAAHGDHALTDPRRSISNALHPGAAALFPDALAVAFDGCGDRITVAYSDHSIFVWDIRNPAKVGRVRSLLGHSGPVWDVGPVPPPPSGHSGIPAVKALPPGTFATCSADGSLRLWNLNGSLGPAHGSTYFKPLVGAAYVQDPAPDHPPSSRPSAAEDQPVGRHRPEQQPPVLRCLRASPDGRHIATGDKRGNLWVFDAVTQEQVAVMEAHDLDVLSVAYSPCGDTGGYLMASGGRDKVVHVYDPQLGYERLATLDDHTGAVTAVVFADGGSRLATCSADRTITFRNLSGEGDPVDDGCERVKVPGSGAIYHMHMEATERYVLASGEDKKFKVYEVATGRHIKTFNLPEGQAGAAVKLHVDDAGITVAAAHADRCVRLYDFFTGTVLGRASGHGDVVTSCFITPDFKRLITASGDSCIFVYKMPEKLSADSQTRAAQLAEDSRAHRAQSSQLDAAAPVSSPGGRASAEGARESKRERLLLQEPGDNDPLQPFDVNSEPLMSERIRQGKAIVSTRKLPKWAQDAAAGLEPSPLGKSPFGEGVPDLPSESSLVPIFPSSSQQQQQQPGGKWAERWTRQEGEQGPAAAAGLPFPIGHRRLTVESCELWPLPSSKAPGADPSRPATSSPSHPSLADAAEAEDDIVYYSDGEEPSGQPADGTASGPEDFVIVDPPEDIADEAEESGVGVWEEGDQLGPGPEAEDAIAEGGEMPRSNLFREHFGHLLEDEPLPAPALDSREAARQSFSSQVRAVDKGATPPSAAAEGRGGSAHGPRGRAEPVPAKDAPGVGGSGPLLADQQGTAGSTSSPEEDQPGSEGDASLKSHGHRKGRLGKEINDMRSRLVDLGLSYAQQQSKARRGRPSGAAAVAASGSSAGALREEREAMRKREESAAQEGPGTISAPVVMLRAESSEFCIGSPVAGASKARTPFEAAAGAAGDQAKEQQEEDEDGNIVKEAVGEIQQQQQQQNGPGGARADHGAAAASLSRRLERSRSSGRSSRTSLPSSRKGAGRSPAPSSSASPATPPLPDGVPPPEAVSLSSSRAFQSPPSPDGASPATGNGPTFKLPSPAALSQPTPLLFKGSTKFANPEFGLSPIVNTAAPEEEAAAAAALRRLSTQAGPDGAAAAAAVAAEAAAQQPMAPGHQVVSVVCCSTEAPVPSAPAAAEKNQEPAPKKSPQSHDKPQQQSGAGARLTNLLGRLKGSRTKASPTAAQQEAKDVTEEVAAAAKPSSPEAALSPQSTKEVNGAASRDGNPKPTEMPKKGDHGSAFPFALPEIQKAPPSVAASSESKKGLESLRGSRIRGLRRSQEGGSDPNAAAATALNPRQFTAGPSAAVATPASAFPPPAEEAAEVREQWASLPDAGASLLSLRAAVAEVESMQKALIRRASNSGGDQQKILEAEIAKAVAQLSSLSVAPTPVQGDRALPSPGSAKSPVLQVPENPHHVPMATPQMQHFAGLSLEQSIASSININELSHQMESVLETSAEKAAAALSDRFLHILEQKLPELLQQKTPRQQQTPQQQLPQSSDTRHEH